jgi:hypothetical protein
MNVQASAKGSAKSTGESAIASLVFCSESNPLTISASGASKSASSVKKK